MWNLSQIGRHIISQSNVLSSQIPGVAVSPTAMLLVVLVGLQDHKYLQFTIRTSDYKTNGLIMAPNDISALLWVDPIAALREDEPGGHGRIWGTEAATWLIISCCVSSSGSFNEIFSIRRGMSEPSTGISRIIFIH